jgi:hypothetical protein
MTICGADIEKIIDCQFYQMKSNVSVIYKKQKYETPTTS